jgi:hypothetical protein
MNHIPKKYQVFDLPVELDSKDVERLSPHLSGWNKLNEMFLLGMNESDLRRLVVIELMEGRRWAIINRLLGRLAKVEREKYKRRIERALS